MYGKPLPPNVYSILRGLCLFPISCFMFPATAYGGQAGKVESVLENEQSKEIVGDFESRIKFIELCYPRLRYRSYQQGRYIHIWMPPVQQCTCSL